MRLSEELKSDLCGKFRNKFPEAKKSVFLHLIERVENQIGETNSEAELLDNLSNLISFHERSYCIDECLLFLFKAIHFKVQGYIKYKGEEIIFH